MTINEVLPVILYVLGAIFMTTLIVLTVKLIITTNKINKIVDNITVKVSALDELFNVIELVGDKFAFVTDRVIDGVASLIEKVFKRKGEKIDE